MSDAPGGITAATPEQTDRVTANESDGGKLDCTIRETFTRLANPGMQWPREYLGNGLIGGER